LIRADCPALEKWLADNTSRVVEFAPVWPDLLKVCRYFLANPRPGLYSRELPVEVDTKFIERHQSVLVSLLDFLLPAEARMEAERFEERFGLRFDEPSIRFRILDEDLKRRFAFSLDDVAAPISQFRNLNWESLQVVIVENKMTFLTLPALPNAIGIWGGGGAAELLTSVLWLAKCELIYWGDIDVHGFHILARLRSAFPHVQSLMMDQPTFQQFRRLAVAAKDAAYERVKGLTEDERQIYSVVSGAKLVLEQEKIPFDFVRKRFSHHAGQFDERDVQTRSVTQGRHEGH